MRLNLSESFTITLVEIHLVDRGWHGQDRPFVRIYDTSTTPELREAILLKFRYFLKEGFQVGSKVRKTNTSLTLTPLSVNEAKNFKALKRACCGLGPDLMSYIMRPSSPWIGFKSTESSVDCGGSLTYIVQ